MRTCGGRTTHQSRGSAKVARGSWASLCHCSLFLLASRCSSMNPMRFPNFSVHGRCGGEPHFCRPLYAVGNELNQESDAGLRLSMAKPKRDAVSCWPCRIAATVQYRR